MFWPRSNGLDDGTTDSQEPGPAILAKEDRTSAQRFVIKAAEPPGEDKSAAKAKGERRGDCGKRFGVAGGGSFAVTGRGGVQYGKNSA